MTALTILQKLANIFQAESFLTTENRQTMNNLVDAMNAQLVCIPTSLTTFERVLKLNYLQSAAVERAGPSVMFVNYDSYVGLFGGRYCNAGVNEAIVDSNTR